MEALIEQHLLNTIFNCEIQEVPETTRFWMIRTNRGFFYNDFVINKYVALGWNVISKETDLSEQSLEELKELLKQKYDEKVPTTSINKCKNFMYEIKEGDIIIIPSAKTEFVTFAIAGEYYEIDKSYEEEIEVASKIKNSELQVSSIRCPYKKRRRITILKTVKSETINYHLFRGITTNHGISNFDKYGDFILDSIYNLYTFNDVCSLQIGINTLNPIKARELSKLVYGITEYMCTIIPEEDLTITLNLNSPGRISLKVRQFFNHIKNYKMWYLFILIAITGGKGAGVELNGLPGFIKDCCTLKSEIEKENIEVELKKLELEKGKSDAEKLKAEIEQIKLENLMKKYDIKQMLEKDNIDVDTFANNIDIILKRNNSLELGINDNIDVEYIEYVENKQLTMLDDGTETTNDNDNLDTEE